ncbi:MAG TPA: TonB-dependent receptor [Vicinamibacterales bacterium]|nr:TonB-dependent receptor [Vicinamibacterales bacterium]
MPRRFAILLAVCALLLPASFAFAQQNATLQGTVLDDQKGVMPGATVTAIDTRTGRQTAGVTGVDGRFGLENLPPGEYTLRIELQGFATAELTNIELLVGVNATVPPVTLKLASLQETVTVSSQAPIVDLSSARVSGNIDRRQMAELPLQGRNWMELSLMVKGITANNIGNTPGVSDDQFQLNLDGQQVSQRISGSGFGQPKMSRESIAEFQIVTNMYDITQGRSTGVQVQAVSRSGTNDLRGSAFGFFRSDKFNAADPVRKVVLPYSDQQTGFTLGGPIVKDRLHYFGSYEYERNPSTAVLTPTALPNQSWSLPSNTIQKNYLARGDLVKSSKDNVSVRLQRWELDSPFQISSGTTHPTMAEHQRYYSTNLYGTWTRVPTNHLTMQVHVGTARFSWYDDPIPSNSQAFRNLPFGVPVFSFPNLSLGGQQNFPNYSWMKQYPARIEMNWHAGRHDMKWGAEYLKDRHTKVWDLNRRGTFTFNRQPSTAILEAAFPQDAWDDPSRWDLSLLQPYLQQYSVFFHKDYLVNVPRSQTAAWFGDNWRPVDDLTVNLGIRYDLDWNGLNPPGVRDIAIPIDNGRDKGDFGYHPGVRDTNNFGPRVGFAWNVGGTNSLVIRGGTGLYYNFPVSNVTYRQQFYNNAVAAVFLPSGTNFLNDPLNGVSPDAYLSSAVPAPPQETTIISPGYVDPYGWQSTIGFQKQLGSLMGFDVDFTDLEERSMVRSRDVNLFFDPVTGYVKDPVLFGRPNPAYGLDQWLTSDGKTQSRLLSSSFTRRFNNMFQASSTYTLALSMKDNTTGFGYQADNPFNPNADWATSTGFQRHTFRSNGIVRLPWEVSLSGSYFYGSGARYNPTSSTRPYSKPGTNRLNIGAPITIPAAVVERWDGPAVIATGTTWTRNGLKGLPLHKVDMRVTKTVTLSNEFRIELLAELFNVFNRKNYGAYTTTITSANFGLPVATSGNAYVPRQGQLGVRVSF